MKKIHSDYLQKLKGRNEQSLEKERVVVDGIYSIVGFECDPLKIKLNAGVIYVSGLPTLLQSEVKLKKKLIISEIISRGLFIRDII